MTAQFPSDVTPGIAPRTLDWHAVNRELDRFDAKLRPLRPFVKINGGLFTLYWLKLIVVQALTAQMILDYCEGAFPRGTKIQWIIIPQPRPAVLTAADVT